VKTLSLELVTPHERLYRGEVRSVALPAVNGEMGVLPGHAPFLGLLTEGHVTVRIPAKQAEGGPRVLTFKVSGGSVEVLPDHVTVFADSAEPFSPPVPNP
jgi:F-type H+-transporting ATPase subunit epsilon